MDIQGGTTLANLTPVQLEVLYHGCLSVERQAIRGSNMEKEAKKLAAQLRPLIVSY